MSLVEAVHELIDVAVGRKNLSAQAADELHDAINAEAAPGPTSPASGETGSTEAVSTSEAPPVSSPTGSIPSAGE